MHLGVPSGTILTIPTQPPLKVALHSDGGAILHGSYSVRSWRSDAGQWGADEHLMTSADLAAMPLRDDRDGRLAALTIDSAECFIRAYAISASPTLTSRAAEGLAGDVVRQFNPAHANLAALLSGWEVDAAGVARAPAEPSAAYLRAQAQLLVHNPHSAIHRVRKALEAEAAKRRSMPDIPPTWWLAYRNGKYTWHAADGGVVLASTKTSHLRLVVRAWHRGARSERRRLRGVARQLLANVEARAAEQVAAARRETEHLRRELAQENGLVELYKVRLRDIREMAMQLG